MRGRVFGAAMSAALAIGSLANAALAQDPVVPGPAPAYAPAPAQKGDVVRYRIERGPNVPVVITGSILFIGGYGGALAASWASDRPEYDKMYIPIVGPFLTLAEHGTCSHLPCAGSNGEKVFLVIDGMFQSVGLIMAVAGLVIPETKLVPVKVGSSTTVHVAPTGGPGGAGFSAIGTF